MPVSVVCRHVVTALVAASVLILVVLAAAWAVTLATPVAAAPAARLTGDGARARLDAVRVDLVPGGSEARYRALEVLSGRGVNEAVGTTTAVQGSILFDASGTILADQSRIMVDLTTLQSDSAMRDRYIQRATLQTQQYPTAEFVVTAAPGLPNPLPTSGVVSFELVGDLTVHGVTRLTSWQATATFSEGSVTGSAATTVLMTDFGMEPPRAGPVVSIEDSVRLELDVRGTVAPSLADLVADPS